MDREKASYERLYTSNIQVIHKVTHIESWKAKVPFIPKTKSFDEIIF